MFKYNKFDKNYSMENSLISDLKKNLFVENKEREKHFDSKSFLCENDLFDLKFKNKFYVDVLTDGEFLDSGSLRTERYEQFYFNLTGSDVGLIVTGGACPKIKHYNKNSTILDNKFNIDFLSDFVQKIHSKGTKIFFKIKPNFGRFDTENKFMGIFPCSASMNPSGVDCRLTCARVSDGFANEMVDEFVRLARLAQIVGFDGVVVDASNNLLGEFASFEFNKRLLGYYSEMGELSIKIVNKINNACNKIPIIYKSNLFSFASLVFEENLHNVKTLKGVNKESSFDDLSALFVELVKNGVDGFIFENGLNESEFLRNFMPYQKQDMFPEFYMKFKELFLRLKIKNKFNENVSFFLKDNLDFQTDYGCEFYDITKEIYADLNFIKSQKTHFSIKNCIKCNKCVENARIYAKNICSINPELSEMVKIKNGVLNKKNVAIVGGGLSGIYCALTLAERNFVVDLYESDSKLNHTGDMLTIYGFDKFLKFFNNALNKKVQKYAKLNKINIYTNTNFDIFSNTEKDYKGIVVATGFKEKSLTINGAIQKHVKSIYEVLKSEDVFVEKKNILIYAKSELGLKLALFLLKRNKKVSIIIRNTNFLFKMPNANLTYYFYVFNQFNVKVYFGGVVKQIHEDSVDVVINANTSSRDVYSTVLNLKSNYNYKFVPKLKNIDLDLFVYEPQIVPNNKLYYDIVASGFKGEVYMIGNALQVGDMTDDVKSAFYVGNNMWVWLDFIFLLVYNLRIKRKILWKNVVAIEN